MSDREFKATEIKFPQGIDLTLHTNGTIIGNDKYKPDKSFVNSNNEIVLVIESTSTGDRKVGVGELLQAEMYFAGNNISGTLIFSLCGKSSTSPKPDSQLDYLRPYFNFLKKLNPESGVTKIYIIDEIQFESVGWEALGNNFIATAKCLS
jgi:hypothetical protein